MEGNESGSWEVEMGPHSVPSLDALPKEILIQAAKDPKGAILVTEKVEGDYRISANGAEWKSEGEPVMRAKMDVAIAELPSRRYVEDTEHDRTMFKVTQLGRQTAMSLT
jgi:hypothetical protein